jgi:lysophospholipase L1-like esterase
MRPTPRSSLLLALTLALATACGGGSDSAPPPPAPDPTTRPPTADASLAALAVSVGALDPAFDPSVRSYTLALANGATGLTLTATVAAVGATLAVQDGAAGAFTPVTSGAPAALAVPAVGTPSTVTVRVTAPDGTTARVYTLQLSQAAAPPAGQITIYSIGDSTMADYLTTTMQAGWGQMFPQFLVGNDVKLVNKAVNGRSSKSFFTEGLWAAVKAKLKKGDYVFIQFGHNDEKHGGLEGTSADPATAIGTAPWGDYAAYLSTYVEEAKALGANPVLVTPVVRRYFSGNTLTAKARHDLTGNGTAVGNADYPAAMKDVGARENVPVIDMTTSTGALVEAYGPTTSKEVIYIAGDDTHLQPLGATLFAQLAAAELVSKGILAAHLNPVADLVVTPSALDFGSRGAGSTADLPITVTGLTLSPAAGEVAFTAPDPFLVATSAAGPFAATVRLPYTSGRLAPTRLYVRFAPAAARSYTGDLAVAPASGAAKHVALSGVGLPAASGAEATLTWPLTADGTCAVTGTAACDPQVLSSLTETYLDAVTVTTWVTESGTLRTPASTITERLTSAAWNVPTGTSVTKETAPVEGRFVEFAVRSATGKAFTVDRVSFSAGAGGSNSLMYQVAYSLEPTFASRQTLVQPASNTQKYMVLRDVATSIAVPAGGTLRIRFYPWVNTSKPSSKMYLALQNVSVHGKFE